jgi:hypothetical protein
MIYFPSEVMEFGGIVLLDTSSEGSEEGSSRHSAIQLFATHTPNPNSITLTLTLILTMTLTLTLTLTLTPTLTNGEPGLKQQL